MDEAGDVPEFVAKVAAGDYFAATESLVDAGAAAGDEAETKCIGAVLGDDFDWVDDVTLGFGHLLAFFV